MPELVFLLGSRVRHVGAYARDLGPGTYGLGRWVPLCGQPRPANDANGLRWPVAATPAHHSRPVCAHCRRDARKIAEAVQ